MNYHKLAGLHDWTQGKTVKVQEEIHKVKIINLGSNCRCGVPHGVDYKVLCTCGYEKMIYDDWKKAEILRDAHEAGTGHKAVNS